MELNKKFLVIFLLAVFTGIFMLYSIIKPKSSAYEMVSATRGELAQAVSETGTVKKGDLLNLSFKSAGKIKSIDVETNQTVIAGQVLATLDINELEIQLQQAEADLEFQQANFDKLMAGASGDEVKIASTAKQNYQIAYDNTKQALSDATNATVDKKNSIYQTGFNSLQNAYNVAYNIQNFVGLLQRTYFAPQGDDSILVCENSRIIDSKTTSLKEAIDNIPSAQSFDAIDNVLDLSSKTLARISDLSLEIRNICENDTWRDTVSIADKTNLDAQRSYIVATLAQIDGIIKEISLTKSANESSINGAKAALISAEGQLNASHNSFDEVVAKPDSNDIKKIQSQIKSSQAQVELSAAQIANGNLAAPANGQIADVKKRPGEMIQAGELLISMIPESEMTINSKVPESDIADIALGNQCNITFDAISGRKFSGKVVIVNSAPTVISGIVYYETTISLDKPGDAIKPGMTANVDIVTAQVSGALKVPSRAIIEHDGKKFVRMSDGKKIKEIEIQTGLSNSFETQIISGLNDSDKVII